MAEYVIQNDSLKLTVSSHGAEIKSLIRKNDGREIMWQADPAYWNRTSPVLFPLVGNYKNKTSVHEGKAYSMGQHGFARDMEFELKDKKDEEIFFTLKENEETLKKYPFAFLLELGYRLMGDTVEVIWSVKNTNDSPMYFSIGGHPAFNCDLENSRLKLYKDGETVHNTVTYNIIEGDGSGCLSDRQKTITPDENGSFAMSYELFSEDALILENRQADAVELIDEKGEPVVRVSFDAPLFGLWSPVGKNAPFVCIEPWYGRCDRADFDGELKDRQYGNTLQSGSEFPVSYKIQVL